MESSPHDLAVLFRSLERREREARDGVPRDHPDLAALMAELARHVSAAGRLTDALAEPEAIAGVLEHRPAASWTEAELTHLREIGLHLGRLLRSIEARAAEIRAE
jgi:hypothetical protein